MLLRRKETTGESAQHGPLTLWVVKGEVKISLAHNPLGLGNLPTGGGTTAHFPINIVRHWLSTAYLLLALKSPELGPRDSQLRPASPPRARSGSRLVLVGCDSPSPPFRHCQDGVSRSGGGSGCCSQRRRRRQRRPQREGESRLTETAGLGGRGCRAGRSAGLGMS